MCFPCLSFFFSSSPHNFSFSPPDLRLFSHPVISTPRPSDGARRGILDSLPGRLRHQLHLSYSGVNDNDLSTLTSCCSGPFLRTIDVSGNRSVTDKGLLPLLRACPNVQILFAYDTGITDDCVRRYINVRDIKLKVVRFRKSLPAISIALGVIISTP